MKFEKKSFPLVYRACRDESIRLMHNIKDLGQSKSPKILLKILVQTFEINFRMYSQRPFE